MQPSALCLCPSLMSITKIITESKVWGSFMNLSLVVPCYNEEDNIYDFYDCVNNCFKNCGFTYECVFVNDGSLDNTFDKLKQLANKRCGNIQVVSFSRNFGKESAIYAGLSQIPNTSRLYKQVCEIIDLYKSGKPQSDAFALIHSRYNNENSHDWCHTISNALIVTAALLYGEGKFGKSICMAVETGFDTDCNGATVGSIVGMMFGIDNIEREWIEPLNGVLETQILGHDKSNIDDLVSKTLEHIKKFN